eukprot:CAMPEP_0115529294 /NCGR_PEP_ID=MMETSP0271-20121206/83861_1 /TAXON_ID=71861 /ORGANISM="Scrippsiella trochoidea, Strain CCMP3099" /LENGTH=40 /DNA_ID= /DNA_START= /DNA_END= /DNA_ORIENTATION=
MVPCSNEGRLLPLLKLNMKMTSQIGARNGTSRKKVRANPR